MRRFFNILLGALAMIAVGLLSAFITMRLAIHGREVEIPNVAGLTVAEAKGLASNLGLNLKVEDRFYSTVTPAGRVLSQYPAPGTKVRREWVMRVAESTGPQKVSVPNVIGETEREATATVRRLSLDLGTVAYVEAPVPPGIVLSQTPTPAAEGVDGPRISLLVSEPISTAKVRPVAPAEAMETPVNANASPVATTVPAATEATAANTVATPEAYVMPNLVGLTLSAATARVAAIGLHISSMDSVAPTVRDVAPIAEPAAPGSSSQPYAIRPIAPITLANTVVAQMPPAGHRVTKADAVRITLSR
jgi:beta-lactam-binding protein with PASTA domain